MSATVGRPPSARGTGVVSGVAIATAAFGVVLIAGIWITVPARVALERQEALVSQAATNANLVLALEEQTNQRLRALDQFLLLMRHQYEQPPPRVPFSALLAPAFADTSGITLIAALDEHGDVLEVMTPGPALNAADRPMFRFHQQDPSRDLAIGAPILGRVSGKWVITLTRRVNRPDGSFGGIVDISVEPSLLTALYEKTALGPDDIMSQVLENGLTLSRRHGGTASFGEDVSNSALMREYDRQPVGAYIGRGALDGHLRLFSYRRLTDYPVIAVVGTSHAAALAPPRLRARTYYTMAALASVAIAAVCAAGVWMSARQQRSNRRLIEQAWLLDEAQDAIVVSGLDRRITYWNRSAERLYGWPAAEALGRTMADLLYAGDPAFIEAALSAVGQSGAWLGELHPVARNGRRVVAESRWTLVRDASGAPLSILTIDSDVTERRQFEQQSYRAQRLESLGTLAGGIA
ncbi:MAG: PAS domain-containing protein, partial [Acidobacteria bacterium]|nr:PAS domain-containing protein [Acidobacteriota bacterium]